MSVDSYSEAIHPFNVDGTRMLPNTRLHAALRISRRDKGQTSDRTPDMGQWRRQGTKESEFGHSNNFPCTSGRTRSGTHKKFARPLALSMSDDAVWFWIFTLITPVDLDIGRVGAASSIPRTIC